MTVLNYPTHVDVCVVTDNRAALSNVFLDWELGSSLWVCETEKDTADTNEYALLFEHRQVMKQAFQGVSLTPSVGRIIRPCGLPSNPVRHPAASPAAWCAR